MGILVELKIPGWGSPEDVLSVVLQHADDMKEVRHVCTRLHQRLDGVFCAMKSKEINDEASQAEALDKFVAVLTKSSICFERYHEKRLVRRLVKYQTLMDDVHAINEDIDGLHAVLNVKPTDWRQQWEADKRAQQDVMEPIVLFNRLEVELIRQNGCASDQQNEVKPKTELKCCGACNASIAGEQCMCSSCGSYLFVVMVAATKEADSNQPSDSWNSDVNFANENATDSGAKMNTPETVHSDLESLESSQEDITHLLEHGRTGNEEEKRIPTEELAKLVSHDEIRAHIMEEGILPPLIHLLRTGTDRQKAWATNALVEVSAMNDGTRAAVAREGVIPPLVALVRAKAFSNQRPGASFVQQRRSESRDCS